MSEIKVTGTPMTYGNGATRNTKEGKGRFDLIPPEPMEFIIERLSNIRIKINDANPYFNDEFDVYRRAMRIHNSFGINEFEIDNLADTIISLILYKEGYAKCYALDKLFADHFSNEFFATMRELAVHFENGAKIYGEHNCENGIPKWSFVDSGLRHLTQFLNGEDDENHYISAIWNFWMLMWTVIKEESEVDNKHKTILTRFDVDEMKFDPSEMIGVVIDPELVEDNNESESEGDDNE